MKLESEDSHDGMTFPFYAPTTWHPTGHGTNVHEGKSIDEFDLEKSREQQITIEMLGASGTHLLAEAQDCPIPLVQDDRNVAMVIEIEQFDRDWKHRDDPETLAEEDARNSL